MKFLLLFIAFSICIAGFIFKKDANRKTQSNLCIISGILLVFAYLLFWRLGISIGISGCFIVVTFVMASVYFALILKDFPPISTKLTALQNCWLKRAIYFAIVFVFILLGIYAAKLPTVTLENGIIQMPGNFGGDFNVANIQSIDTISVLPNIGYRRGGSSSFGTAIGNFDLENEEKTAKLYIYSYRPPFIKIRMNDNRVLLLNFYKPDMTVEFYNRLIN